MQNNILILLCFLPLYLGAQNTDISGFVSNQEGTMVNNVEVKLYDDHGQLLATTQTENGRYSFVNLPTDYQYTLQLSKAGSPLNGLTTFDFVMITKHLLNTQQLPGSLEILAADVDGSGSVSVIDLMYIQQLVLGIIAELPDQRNWLFLPEDQLTSNPDQLNTFSFLLGENSVLRNFQILKIGDVNKTADYE